MIIKMTKKWVSKKNTESCSERVCEKCGATAPEKLILRVNGRELCTKCIKGNESC